MKKGLLFLLVLVLFMGCSNKDNLSVNVISDNKVESSLTEDGNKVNLVLNNKKHTFELMEEQTKSNKRKVSILMDNKEINTYTRVYSDNDLWDFEKYSLIKGTDGHDYFAFALGNWNGSKYYQFLYVFNDDATVIYNIDDKEFGAAFTDFSDAIGFSLNSLYGDTGMIKLWSDKIVYLSDFSYSDGDDFVRCQENILEINDNKVSSKKGEIIKVGRIA